VVSELAERFVGTGQEISLVGGTVRDALMGRPAEDLDLTTSARPETIAQLLAGWADNVWDTGIDFGTLGARKDGYTFEITTYRSEHYDPDSRKPTVEFGDSLIGDLRRRDFTVNAMALRLPQPELIDPHGGLRDLVARRLITPAAAEESFDDDPLRMLRAARFAAQLDFEVDESVVAAIIRMAERLSIVSAERIQQELVKLIRGRSPRRGLAVLVDTGLAEWVLPELPALRLEVDEHHRHKDVYEHTLTVLDQAIALESGPDGPVPGPDFVLRFAALMHDVGKPRTRKFEPGGGVSFHHHEVVGARMTRKRMQELRFSNDYIHDVSKLVELHLRFHGYGGGEWTDSAVRRYVRDAGPLLERLHRLTRADCTTRNRRKASALSRSYDSLEERISVLAEEEELASIRPDLDGNEIMQILGLSPGPEVGEAYRYLLELRLDEGPQTPEQATAALRQWWAERDPG
jgi:poly(A) polymerase